MKINYLSAIISAMVAIIIFCVVAVVFNVMPLDSLPVNFIGAALGALIGALITLVLLKGQTAIEEEKDKNIRILEKKTEVFQGYINTVWDVWEDQVITIEEFQNLRSQYYQNLMIYIKNEESLKTIGNALTEMGSIIDKKSYKNSSVLRKNIVAIINTLTGEIYLGGHISEKGLDIMEEHDKIVFPPLFRNRILESLDERLPADILEKGKFECFKEGKNNPEYIIFKFKNYKGCKMILGPFEEGSKMKFALVIDSNYHQVDNFRENNPYNQRIKMGDIIIGHPVINPDKDIDFTETDNEKIDSIDFSKGDMEKFRIREINFADVLAKRAFYYFEAMKYQNSVSIMDFLEKYMKE